MKGESESLGVSGAPETLDRLELLRLETVEQLRGIDQEPLRRLLLLRSVARADYEAEGPVYREWIERTDRVDGGFANFLGGLRPRDYYALADLAGEYFDEAAVETLDVDERAAAEYLRTLDALVV
jgi:hypothetical protein